MAYLGRHDLSGETGKPELRTLEKKWIAAEARADRAKIRATRAERSAADLNCLGRRDDREVKLLISEAERLVAQRNEAEAEAEAAFERFWNAKSSGA